MEEKEIKQLIDWKDGGEGCIVSKKILNEGYKVGFMYREEPTGDLPDSGWRFLAGNEEDSFMNNSENLAITAINTVCNFDKDIIPYLNSKIGSAFIRISDTAFELDNQTKDIYVCKQ